MENLPGGGGVDQHEDVPVGVRALFCGNDPTQVRETFQNYLQSVVPVTEIAVPGDTRVYRRRSNRSRTGTAALVIWVELLHDLGYSLQGDFGVHEFSIDHLGILRGNWSLLQKIKSIAHEVNGDLEAQDMFAVANIAELNIHSNQPIPANLQHLLGLLKSYHRIYAPLVTKHVCHEDEDGEYAVFLKLHNRLKAIGASDPPRHSMLLQQLGTCEDVPDWPERAMLSVHLHSVLRFFQRTSNINRTLEGVINSFLFTPVRYKRTVEALIDFRRNGQSHLETDYSVDVLGSLEVGLFAAVEGFKAYHEHLRQQLELTLQTQQQQQEVDEKQMKAHHLALERQMQRQHSEQEQVQTEQMLRLPWQQRQQQIQQLRQRNTQQLKQLRATHAQQLNNLQVAQPAQLAQLAQQLQEQLQEQVLKRLARSACTSISRIAYVFVRGTTLPPNATKAGVAAAAQYLSLFPTTPDKRLRAARDHQALVKAYLAVAAISQVGGAQAAGAVLGAQTHHVLAGADLAALAPAATPQGAAAIQDAWGQQASLAAQLSPLLLTTQVPQQVVQTSQLAVQPAIPQAAPLNPPFATMFSANDVAHMYDIIAPSLLVHFQKVMFDNRECFCLGDELRLPKLT